MNLVKVTSQDADGAFDSNNASSYTQPSQYYLKVRPKSTGVGT